MQNPKLTEIENKFKDSIVRVIGFENLVNVVVLSLDEIEKKMEPHFFSVYESKTASKARFVLFGEDAPIYASEEIPIQVPDQPKVTHITV